jgi:hypothetical protein
MSSWPTFDVAEIAQEASERAGVDFRSGYALRTARRSLELLSIEWANRGLNLWTIEGPTPVGLQPGVNKYSLPEDTVDLVEHALRTWNLSDPRGGWVPPEAAPPLSYGQWTPWGQHAYTDLPLTRQTFSEYAAIPNKQALGRPTLIHVRRAIQPYFMLWMTPPQAPFYQTLVWRMRRMKTLGYGGEGQPEIPWRFIPAMIAGLAYYLSLKSKDQDVLQRVSLLKASYEEQFGLASDEDRDRASFFWVPGGYERI